jgi:predicted amidohydrolase
VGSNLEHMRRSLAAAADADAELICFPELSLSGYLLGPADYTAELLRAVQDAERELAADCRRLGIAVVYGAPQRRLDGQLRNAVIHQDPARGRLVYAKTHMDYKERRVFTRGNEFVVDERGIAMACCYDLAFPEATRVLALRGARVLIVPMAWEVRRAFVMHRVLAARAVENIAYVVAVNQCGAVGELRFDGGSRVLDPLGGTAITLGGAPELATVEIDLDWITRLRDCSDASTYPLLEDRRPDLYAELGAAGNPAAPPGVLSQTSVSWAPHSTGIESVR